MTSGKKKEPVKDPALILGPAVDLGDFVTPLKDGRTFLEVQIQVKCGEKDHLGDAAEGGGHGGGASAPDPISRNSVLTVLKDTDPADIKTAEGMKVLKQRIAWQINHDQHKLHEYAKPDPSKEETGGKKKKKGGHAGHFEPIPEKERDYPDLHSDEGPVYYVLFPKFLAIDYGP